jgi:hypothetical protein
MAAPATPQDLINALIAAAQAAAIAAVPAAAPIPPAAAQAPFAVMPGAANVNVLDFNQSDALKLFNKAIAALDTKFDLEEENLRTFIEQVRERARIYNWDGLLTVNDTAGVAKNLINSYGMLTMEECRAQATKQLANKDRMTQDSMMCYQFLINSLTDKAKLQMLSEKDQYYINDVPSGICFLKAIIGRSSIDSTAKVGMLRKKIANLPNVIMGEYKGNIRTFNIYVAEQREQLLGRGKGVEELVTFLFDAYLNVPDDEFRRYIEVYRDRHDEGKPIDDETLMRVALNKYEVIQHRKDKSSEGEERVMALVTKPSGNESSDSNFNELVLAIKDLQANLAKKENSPAKGKKKGRKLAEWKKVAPKANESLTKESNGKTYHWCEHHRMWTIHTPGDCTLGKESGDLKQNNATPKNEANNGNPRLALNRALLTFLEQEPSE